MAVSTQKKAKNQKKAPKKSARPALGRPHGSLQARVQAVGPEHFAVVSVDCAKRRCKWMMCTFYGVILVPPTETACNRASLQSMVLLVKDQVRRAGIKDLIVAVELTGVYHRPVIAAFRAAGLETREVHSFATNHFRSIISPDIKTDDKDLEAIFQAAIAGFGLIKPEVPEIYRTLQILSRHRRNLVQQRARIKVQIRDTLHQTMPGFCELFSTEKFFEKTIAISIAREFASAEQIQAAGVAGISDFLRQNKITFRSTTVENVVAWAAQAAPACPQNMLMHSIWCELDDLRQQLTRQIRAATRKMAENLVATPYCLLLSLQGVNVVLAAELAGEAGPIEYYPTAKSINGRAGLFPRRYQSDEVNNSGSLAHHGNRRLRAALMRMAECLAKHHPKYRLQAGQWLSRGVAATDRKCRIANRICRVIFQLVSGKQVYRRHYLPSDYILKKLLEFHHEHESPANILSDGLTAAMQWLPKHIRKHEAQPLQELVQKRSRRIVPIGDVLAARIAALLGETPPSEVESTTSEARS